MSAAPTDLLAAASDLPRHERERLLAAAVGVSRVELMLLSAVDSEAVVRFEAFAERRRQGEPLQYVEGTVQFGPIELLIDSRALIPRPETEQLWELVTNRYMGAPNIVVDLCAGSGNLALALKHEWSEARVVATELSPAAAQLAKENSAYTGLDIDVCVGDLFEPLPGALAGAVDVLVANPPYLDDHELATLPREVRDHEPEEALVAGSDGTEVLRRIADGATKWLRPGGLVACEISEFCSAEVAEMFRHLDGEVLPDLTGRPRFLVGALPVVDKFASFARGIANGRAASGPIASPPEEREIR